MKNDPEKWEQQQWVITFEQRLLRIKDQWFLEPVLGFRIPIDEVYGKQLADYLTMHFVDERERQ